MLQHQGQEVSSAWVLGSSVRPRHRCDELGFAGFAHDASSRPSCSATRSRARESFLRRASALPPSSAAIAAQSSPWFLNSSSRRSSGESRR